MILALSWLLVGGIFLQAQPPVRPVTPAQQERRAARQLKQAQQKAARPVPLPGELAVDRLSRMTPQQRERALSSLPPARRLRLEQKLREFENLPPAQQDRVRSRLELLNSLPPQRQAQVRRSMREFNQMAPDRRQPIGQALRRMAPLPDEERRAYLNSEDFRNRFSEADRQLMNDLIEVLPQPARQ